ncbi:hypothetical protein BRC88_02650 [Halobacteriales archaeon QS_4_69_225]|nr:MAG: hypothetical protein BRC88_02650 [Halobacteriales archaeon QS_4_69_225]
MLIIDLSTPISVDELPLNQWILNPDQRVGGVAIDCCEVVVRLPATPVRPGEVSTEILLLVRRQPVHIAV